MNIYENNKELLSILGVEGNYNTDFEVRKAILNALGGDASTCNSIYEVDLQILKIYQEGGGGTGGGKWKVPNEVLFYRSDWTEIPEELDFSEKSIYYIGGYGCFQNNTRLKSINHPLKGNVWNNAFSGCSALTTISSIDISGVAVTNFLSGIFSSCKALSNINFIGSIDASISFPFNTLLMMGAAPTDDTLRSILTACANTTNTNAKTLSLGTVVRVDSTGEWAELVAACNSKGWTISGLTLN